MRGVRCVGAGKAEPQSPLSRKENLPAIINGFHTQSSTQNLQMSSCRGVDGCTRSDQTRSTLAGVCGRVSSPTCRRQLARSHSNVQHSAFSPVTDGVNGARTQQVVREHGLIRTLRLLSILTQAALRGQGGSSLPEGAQLDYHCTMSNEPSAKAAKELRLLEEDDEFEEFKKQRTTPPAPLAPTLPASVYILTSTLCLILGHDAARRWQSGTRRRRTTKT